MKVKFSAIVVLLLLTACSGGGGSTPAAVPTGSASGTVLDGLILNGTVTAYDYSNGTKGSVLGQATTNTTDGTYSLSIQAESRPILLEITGGYYNEEMDPATNIPLDTGDKMQAVINYTTGASITTSITAYTTAAAGLAAYEIKKGTAVATAIDDANKRFSNLVGLDIIKTVPLEITNPANASASLTPSLQYGFLAGGISMWVHNNYPNQPGSTVQPLQKPYISIKFVQLMYQDIVADGQLDGMGVDNSGNPVQLSFGTAPLTPTVYRQGIGVSMLQIAQNVNNKTGLDSSKVLPFGEAYAGSTDPMWAGVTPLPITSPTVTITSPSTNGWLNNAGAITANVQDYIGVSYNDLLLDGAMVTTSTATPTTPSFALGTTAVADGPHQITVRATNSVGLQGTATVTANIDNTPPSVFVSTAAYGSAAGVGRYCVVTGSVADSASGPGTTVSGTWSWAGSATINHASGTVTNGQYSVTFNWANGFFGTSSGGVYPYVVITATDKAGNTASSQHVLTTNADTCAVGATLGPACVCTLK